MKSWLAHLVLLCVALTGASLARGQSPEAQASFDAAQQRFAQAMERRRQQDDALATRQAFYESATEFATLYEDGARSANVCVNAGNGFYLAGDTARALLWYLRAEQLANRPEIRSGVAALRRVCGGQHWPAQQGSIGRVLMFWHFDLARTTKQMYLLILFPLGTALVIVSLFVRRRRVLVRLGIGLMLIGGTLGVSDLVATARPEPPPAVVLSDTVGRTGNGQGYSVSVHHLTAGQEVRLLEQRDDWLRVQLPDQSTCWIPAATAERV